MSFRIRFWGTRGSIPSPGPSTLRHGGNTPCVELRTDEDRLVVLDAGTGIRELGKSLVERAGGARICGDMFFSHAHWDHIQGLPFFTPAFQDGNQFTLFGSPHLQSSLDVVVRQQMSPVVFPVAFDQLEARMDVRELTGYAHTGHGYEMHAVQVRHPGGALGFRFNASGRPDDAVVFIPDNELDVAGGLAEQASSLDTLVGFARGARVLIHDAMYTGTEYMEHRGWGHSSYRDAVEFAIAAEVETLVLFHHDPDRTDDELEEQVSLCRAMVTERGGHVRIVAAAEGMELEV